MKTIITINPATEPPDHSRWVIGLFADGEADMVRFNEDVWQDRTMNPQGLTHWFEVPSREIIEGGGLVEAIAEYEAEQDSIEVFPDGARDE